MEHVISKVCYLAALRCCESHGRLQLHQQCHESILARNGRVPEFYPGCVLRVTFDRAVSAPEYRRVIVGVCLSVRKQAHGTSFLLRWAEDGVAKRALVELVMLTTPRSHSRRA
jgi:hypothetical protein